MSKYIYRIETEQLKCRSEAAARATANGCCRYLKTIEDTA